MIEELVERYGIGKVSGRELAEDDLEVTDKTPRKIEQLAIEAGFEKQPQPLELTPGQYWDYYWHPSFISTVTRYDPETNQKIEEPVSLALYVQQALDPKHTHTDDITTRVFLRVLDKPHSDPDIIAENGIFLKKREGICSNLPEKFYNKKSEARQNAKALGWILGPPTAAYISIVSQTHTYGPLALGLGFSLICIGIWYAKHTVEKDKKTPVRVYDDLCNKFDIYTGDSAVRLLEAIEYTITIPEPPQICVPPESAKPNINLVREHRPAYKKPKYRRAACSKTTKFMTPQKRRAATTTIFLIE